MVDAIFKLHHNNLYKMKSFILERLNLNQKYKTVRVYFTKWNYILK